MEYLKNNLNDSHDALGSYNNSVRKKFYQRKRLPMFAKEFIPSNSMIPAVVFVGSANVIGRIKARRLSGTYCQVCIMSNDDPSAFNWSFLKGLPVIIQVANDFAVERIKSLVIELAKVGVTDITSINDFGKILVVYKWSKEASK